MISLKQRFNRFWGLGLLLIFCIQWGLAVVVIDQSTDAYVLSRLKHDLESILVALDFSEDGLPDLNQTELNPTFLQPFSGHYYHLRAAGLDIYAHSLWNTALPIMALPPGKTGHQELSGPQGQILMVYSAHYVQGSNDVEISVAEDLSPLILTIKRFSWGYALVSLLFLLLLLGLQNWLLQRSLLPLEQMGLEIQALARGERQKLSEAVPLEILSLVQEFNHLIAVLDRRQTRSRNALSNLAHALKKPLSLIHHILEPTLAITPEKRLSLKQQAEQIRRLIDHELRRGQVAGASPLGEIIDLSLEIPLLIHLLERSYPDKQIEIILDLPSQHVFSGDRHDLLELCGNLLDNAFKWADSKVRVVLSDLPGLELKIEDDGPGCPLEKCQYLLERGKRLDRNQPGHGFGLAIVQEIAQAYGGSLSLDRAPEWGGMKVEVSLPVQTGGIQT